MFSSPTSVAEVNTLVKAKSPNINSVDGDNNGKWVRIKVGIDSCAAVSVTPETLFPESQFPVQSTPHLGEDYVVGDGNTITNTGQQTIQAYTNEYIPIQQRFQRTQVHRPLAAVSELEDNNKTVVFSKRYGCFVLDDATGVRAEINREDGTYHMDQWVFLGQA
jgi:hypothetical protein